MDIEVSTTSALDCNIMVHLLSSCGSGTETGYAQECRINRFLEKAAGADEEGRG